MDKKLLENLLQNVENKEDIINQIYAEYGKEVNKLRADNEALKSDKLTLENEKSELNKKLEGFKDYETLKETNAQLNKQIADTKLAQEKAVKDSALNDLLKASNVKDARAIKGFIDESKLQWDDEKKSWSGLSEQLETLKKEQSYLFQEPEAQHQNVGSSDGVGNVDAETLALRNL